MSKRSNPAKEAFLKSRSDLPVTSIDDHVPFFRDHLLFSLRYFDASQPAGQDFSGWDHPHLVKLLTNLMHYSKESAEYWLAQRVGAGGLKRLVVYGKFPLNSGFTHPKFVPDDVLWARFRLEQNVRLCGFLLPPEKVREYGLRKNVFYIVFLDIKHQFYIPEDN